MSFSATSGSTSFHRATMPTMSTDPSGSPGSALAAVPPDSFEKNNFLDKLEHTNKICTQVQKYLVLRNDFPAETKLLLWIDRFQILAMTFQFMIQASLQPTIEVRSQLCKSGLENFQRTQQHIEVAVDSLVNEFQSFCRHVYSRWQQQALGLSFADVLSTVPRIIIHRIFDKIR